MMIGSKGKSSRFELLVRRLLFASGYRFRLHRRDLRGSPDIVMRGGWRRSLCRAAFGVCIETADTQSCQRHSQPSGRQSCLLRKARSPRD